MQLKQGKGFFALLSISKEPDCKCMVFVTTGGSQHPNSSLGPRPGRSSARTHWGTWALILWFHPPLQFTRRPSCHMAWLTRLTRQPTYGLCGYFADANDIACVNHQNAIIISKIGLGLDNNYDCRLHAKSPSFMNTGYPVMFSRRVM